MKVHYRDKRMEIVAQQAQESLLHDLILDFKQWRANETCTGNEALLFVIDSLQERLKTGQLKFSGITITGLSENRK